MDVAGAKAFVYAVIASATAAHHCTGMAQDEAQLAALHKAAGLAKSDAAWLAQQFQSTDQQVKLEIAAQGLPKWCASMWDRLGPAPALGVLRKP